MSNYPEHEKLKKIQDKSQTIGEFLEWLQSENIVLCSLDRHDQYCPNLMSTERRLAEFFEINLDKIEKEKRQMIKLARATS